MEKILIVEDHDILIESFKVMLKDKYEVVGAIRDAKLASLYCARLKPTLVLMDVLTLNNSDGIEATNEIKNKFPDIKVLITTGFDGVGYIKRAKDAKADGYITKNASKEEILDEIELVLNGRGTFPIIDDVSGNKVELTQKENNVLALVCEGLTRQEIAEKLFVSEATVKSHLNNLFQKTNTRNRTELAIFAVMNGYVKMDSL